LILRFVYAQTPQLSIAVDVASLPLSLPTLAENVP